MCMHVLDVCNPYIYSFSVAILADTTWNESRVPLNRTKVLQTVPAKSTQLYKQIEEYQKDQLGQIKEQWPHFSEYTDRYAMKTRILPVLDQ